MVVEHVHFQDGRLMGAPCHLRFHPASSRVGSENVLISLAKMLLSLAKMLLAKMEAKMSRYVSANSRQELTLETFWRDEQQ